MKYNLSAIEIMKFLGYCEPVGREKIKAFEQANQMILPESYRNFMELADGCPMLDTGDIWNSIDRIYFYYDSLNERILDECVLWDENPEAYQKDELYQLSQIPKEEWKTKVPNVLEIGSDYGGGIVMFGIAPDTMQEKNPPLYFQHEVDPCTLWRPDPTGRTISKGWKLAPTIISKLNSRKFVYLKNARVPTDNNNDKTSNAFRKRGLGLSSIIRTK